MPELFVFLFLAMAAFIVFVFAMIIRAGIGRSRAAAAERRANEALPVATNPVTVTSRRTEVTGGGETSALTTYYATFEFANGARQEFKLTGGLMVQP